MGFRKDPGAPNNDLYNKDQFEGERGNSFPIARSKKRVYSVYRIAWRSGTRVSDSRKIGCIYADISPAEVDLDEDHKKGWMLSGV